MASPEDGEGSCHSSHISNKSEKNMADFEGEDLLSDEELAQINAHAHYNSHQMQQHLSSLESMYHTHMPHGERIFKSKFISFIQLLEIIPAILCNGKY